ncbi:DUF599 domain-containing protein [Paracoccus aerodenitrificans]|uniref:DUF599 domain-containing protein n=1 Tax=Paracoccus aerodenitrificans TaxID=3017781 RepID=UPI0022F125E8|nr:DUF599 domain-containing protein [Paracoccus aerodenitrificans]WBU62888.1 DUF599 domain-containing protein [Paracoccus aerodenitrificans]
MILPDHLWVLAPSDIAALCWLFVAWLGIGHIVQHPPAGRPSVSMLMVNYRHEWMRQFITRDPRIFDSAILTTLREGPTFFASACLIAIGGGMALVGNPEQLRQVAGELELGQAPTVLWQVKVITALFFVANALLKFIWSHRLFGYCAILMASVPNDPADPLAAPRAHQAAEINVTAAKSFNIGLRNIYFALAALGWLVGPLGLAITTTVVLAVTWRREFASHSRTVMLQDLPPVGRI